jgi:hypothetical protein
VEGPALGSEWLPDGRPLCADVFSQLGAGLARSRSHRGRLRYGNAAARGIVSMLSAGPASLAEITAKSTLAGQDPLANVLVLCAADAVWPVESCRLSVSSVNKAILRRLSESEELLYLALPCGTAVAMDDALLLLFRGGRRTGAGKLGDWQEFLASHNVSLFGARSRRATKRTTQQPRRRGA